MSRLSKDNRGRNERIYEKTEIFDGLWLVALALPFLLIFTSFYFENIDKLITNLGVTLPYPLGFFLIFVFLIPSIFILTFLPFERKTKIINSVFFIFLMTPVSAFFSFALGMAMGGVYP